MPTKGKGAGRPRAINPDVVSKLEEAFKIDATVQEACFFAGISTVTYYRELKREEQFRNKIERAQNYPYMMAKATIIKAIQRGDAGLAFKWLERRQKELYGLPDREERQEPVTIHQIVHRKSQMAKTKEEAIAKAKAAIAEKQKVGIM